MSYALKVVRIYEPVPVYHPSLLTKTGSLKTEFLQLILYCNMKLIDFNPVLPELKSVKAKFTAIASILPFNWLLYPNHNILKEEVDYGPVVIP